MSEDAKSLLILGLGNDILTDDAIGLLLVRRLAQSGLPAQGVDCQECCEMGLALLDHMTGYEALILVDSIQTGHAPPGTLHMLSGSDFETLHPRSPHFLGVGDTLALGRRLGMKMPDEVAVAAVEVEDPFTLGTALTPTLEIVFPELLGKLREAVAQVMARRQVLPRELRAPGSGVANSGSSLDEGLEPRS